MWQKIKCWLGLIIFMYWGFFTAFGWSLHFEDYSGQIFLVFGMLCNQLWNDFCVER